MKIKFKLLTVLLLVALLPIIVTSFISTYSSQKALRESIEVGLLDLAKEKARSIDFIIGERVAEAQRLAYLPDLIGALRDHNRGYDKIPDQEIQKSIKLIDEAWIKSRGKNETAKRILNSALSGLLEGLQSRHPEKYGELFITDIRGGTVAMTRPLNDYYQADEEWWKESFDDGRGKVFLDYRGYDDSAKALILGVVVPVIDGTEVIGVLKVNFKIRELVNITSSKEHMEHLKSYDSFLLNSQGDIVTVQMNQSREKLTEAEQSILKGPASGITDNVHSGVHTIEAYSSVKSVIHTRVLTPGSRKGISGERWEQSRWYLVLEVSENEVFAPTRKLWNLLIGTGIGIGIIVSFLAFLVARFISTPIEKLKKGAEIIGSGDLKHRIDINSNDELGILSDSFNDMAANLNRITASRDELNIEVIKRKQTELALSNSEMLLKKAQEITHIGHWELNPETNEIVGSDELFRIFGFTREESTFESFIKIVHPEDREFDVVTIRRGIECGEDWSIEHRLLLKDGTEKVVQAIGQAITDETGKTVQLIGTVQDITERKRMEVELQRANDELEVKVLERTSEFTEANKKLKEEIIERKQAEEALLEKANELDSLNKELHDLTVAITGVEENERRRFAKLLHEGIGQNLVVIKLAYDNFAMSCQGDDADSLLSIQEVQPLINDTLKAARDMTSEIYPAPLRDLGFTKAVQWYVKTLLEPTGIEVFMECDGECDGTVEVLPKVTQSILFSIIREAFQNIVKYASATEVTVICGIENGVVRLKVRDNGIGFAVEEVMAREKRGIGQSLMREWGRSLGGELSIGSEPGKGTEVYVEFPALVQQT